MHKGTFIGLTLGVFTAAGVAAAQYPPPPPPAPGYGYPPPGGFPAPRARFGNQGVFAFTNDMNIAFAGHSESSPNPGDTPSHWTLTLKPSMDYFVIQGLSIGGFVEWSHTGRSVPNQNGGGSQTSNSDTFGIGPRVGYNIPIVDAVSWWPLVSLAYTTTSNSDNTGDNAFTLGVYAPFLYHPVSHFFMGLGPFLSTDLSANGSANGQSQPANKSTDYGLQFTIGGWFVT
jgi:hypothetical protein